MFSHLVESVPHRRGIRNVSGTSLSLAVHAFLLFGAIWATRKSDYAVVDTPRYVDLPDVSDPRHDDPPPEPALPSPVSFGQLEAPVSVPVGIPPIDSGFVVDTLSLLRSRVDSAVTPGFVTPAPDNSSVMAEAMVDERPEVISAFVPEYPDLLRQAGIEGTVVIEAVIDTSGRVEPGSVR